MCGIAGTFGIENSSPVVQRMTDRIAHRGPDDSGIYTDALVGLGHRRLAIIDLSPAGHQPMQSADGNLELIYNGEFYNYAEVKALIPEYPFKTQSDSEVILAAYGKWGSKCVDQMNGMFAFAIWDKQHKVLFIARDRLGIKPVYYYRHGGSLLFSSELRSLMASGMVPKKINQAAIADYFTYQTVHAPDTIIENVFMLMPGHTITVTTNGMDIEKYWDIAENRSGEPAGKNYHEVCTDIYNLFEASVKRRLISDVPFGAFLSGGIDSSAVVGMMSKIQTQPVKTFNISFDEGEMSEAKYARIIAKKFNTHHNELLLRPADFLEQLPEALRAIDHPSGDGPNSYVVSKITRQNGITMALSGLGGDELFAGYPIFNRMLQVQNNRWLWHLPWLLRKGLGEAVKLVKPGVTGSKLRQLLLAGNGSVEKIFPLSRQLAPRDELANLLNISMPGDRVEQIVEDILNKNQNLATISKVSVAEITTYMQNTLLRDTDQMSMASALEVRVPFLDYKLVEYVVGMDDPFKIPVFPKKLLVDSLKGLLPDEIVHRRKMGFTFPWQYWMKNELRSFCESRIKSLALRPFIHSDYLLQRWNMFLKGDPAVRWAEIWIGVVLEDWLIEHNIEN